jgi:hypothetical protein
MKAIDGTQKNDSYAFLFLSIFTFKITSQIMNFTKADTTN